MNTIDIGPGLSGLLSFCNWLARQGITYSIHKYADDGLTVFFTIVGNRVEVEFFEDWWNFSFFSGDESVLDTKEELLALIGKHWSRD